MIVKHSTAKISTVLDLTCGTGSQVFWLEKAGFKVVRSDISSAMIKIAQEKARMRHLELKFVEGIVELFKSVSVILLLQYLIQLDIYREMILELLSRIYVEI